MKRRHSLGDINSYAIVPGANDNADTASSQPKGKRSKKAKLTPAQLNAMDNTIDDVISQLHDQPHDGSVAAAR